MTPTALDHLAHYSDAVDSMDFQIDAQAINPGQAGALYFPAAYTAAAAEANATLAGVAGTRPRGFTSYPSNVLGFDINRSISHTEMPKSRGSWKLKALTAGAAEGDARRVPTIADNVVWATFEVTEPLLLSPFVFGSGHGKQGFYGIQTMNFQMNMAPSANRAWRCAIPGWGSW